MLLALAAVAVLWPMTPSVADAGARVGTILAAHGGTPLTALPAPDRVGQALIATEDSRFRSTPGVDPVALARIAWSALRGTGDTGGAGLAQQLAKNLYQPAGSGVWSEVQQVELALKLEATYSKDDVLRMYLSAVYYGHGFYGVTQAARGYFGVSPSRLSWGQAALLAGAGAGAERRRPPASPGSSGSTPAPRPAPAGRDRRPHRGPGRRDSRARPSAGVGRAGAHHARVSTGTLSP